MFLKRGIVVDEEEKALAKILVKEKHQVLD